MVIVSAGRREILLSSLADLVNDPIQTQLMVTASQHKQNEIELVQKRKRLALNFSCCHAFVRVAVVLRVCE